MTALLSPGRPQGLPAFLAASRPFDQADATQPSSLNGAPPPAAPTEDSVAISPIAESAGTLQSLLDQLRQAKTGAGLVDAFKSLQKFVDDQSNATFSSSLLSKLGDTLNRILPELEKDPAALDGFTLNVQASFQQSNVRSEDFYGQSFSFSFSLDIQTKDTALHVGLGFEEGLQQSAGRTQYRSHEYAEISIVSSHTIQDGSPLLDAFGELSKALLGNDPLTLLGAKPADNAAAAQPTLFQGGNAQKLLQSRLDFLKNAIEIQQSNDTKLLDLLKQSSAGGEAQADQREAVA